jgi:hypothetical protein
MAKRKKITGLTKKQKALILPVMVVIGAAAVILAVLAIIVAPQAPKALQRGIAANGFYAYEEQDSDLGVGRLVTKDAVVTALGSKAKSVSDVNVSNVFNYDGDRSQTATFNFVRADGKTASLYIDMTLFQDNTSMNKQHIYADTEQTRAINNHPTYYMHAQTLGSIREYRLLVVNGLKAYKFVIDQAYSSVTISEPTALASLIKLARTANL